MLKLFIIYAVLAVYIDESILNVDAQTAGTAKAPFSKSNDLFNLYYVTSFNFLETLHCVTIVVNIFRFGNRHHDLRKQ